MTRAYGHFVITSPKEYENQVAVFHIYDTPDRGVLVVEIDRRIIAEGREYSLEEKGGFLKSDTAARPDLTFVKVQTFYPLTLEEQRRLGRVVIGF